jgi:catechol 2,3-dioxygenase-like lactoylglutathione lyase family enzyme
VQHDALRTGGAVDHLWIRVVDLAVSRRFYEGLGLPLGADTPGRVRFGGENRSFSLIAGTPTEHLEMALNASGKGLRR